ncbi:MAG: hypothetical protein LQ341_004309 [Variospora aurantia]|nr:MAG: hypothetical protein LQ341_004309 [Variospora aurantia]
MKLPQTLCISLVTHSAFAASVHLWDRQGEILKNRQTVDRTAPQQEAPAADLEQLSNGAPSLSNHSIIGQGPARQRQPDDATAGIGTESYTEGSKNLTTMTAGLGNLTAATTTVLDSSILSTNDSACFGVSNSQYTFQSHPRVDITVSYGSRNTTQTWEVRDGMLYIVPPTENIEPEAIVTTSSMPMGTGDSSASTNSTDTMSTTPMDNGDSSSEIDSTDPTSSTPIDASDSISRINRTDTMSSMSTENGESSLATNSTNVLGLAVLRQGNSTGDASPGAGGMSDPEPSEPLLPPAGGQDADGNVSSGPSTPLSPESPVVARRPPGFTGPKIKVRNGQWGERKSAAVRRG